MAKTSKTRVYKPEQTMALTYFITKPNLFVGDTTVYKKVTLRTLLKYVKDNNDSVFDKYLSCKAIYDNTEFDITFTILKDKSISCYVSSDSLDVNSKDNRFILAHIPCASYKKGFISSIIYNLPSRISSELLRNYRGDKYWSTLPVKKITKKDLANVPKELLTEITVQQSNIKAINNMFADIMNEFK